MTTLLAALYDGVTARLGAELAAELRPTALFGWKAPAEQIRSATGRRIVWTPGDTAGNLGAIAPVRGPGRTPRTLATLAELCTVEITAHAEDAHADERAQYAAVHALYTAFVSALILEAVRLGIGPGVRFVSQAWASGPRGRRSGETLRLVFEVATPIAEALPASEAVRADQAVLDVAHGDDSETLTVHREE